MPRASSFLSIFALFLLVNHPHSSTVFAQQQPHTQEPQCKPKDPTQYDWEQLNYYELLGLSDKDASKKKNRRKKKAGSGSSTNNNKASAISSKEIRKAYRKQAQKYHPDKQASKKKSQNDETATTYEESNARFAKIAEAYEFLLDDDKRRDYDLFLEYCHNTELLQDDDQHEGRLSTVIRKKFSGLFDDLAVENPFKVFKKAVFGDDNDDNENDYFDPNDPFSHLRYKDELQRHPNHQQHAEDEDEKLYQPQGDPVRVFHDKRIMYDPVTGENMIRVLQTEEYAPTKTSQSTSKPNSSSGGTRGGRNSTSTTNKQQQQQKQFYYRIVAQDFREGYDPHNAKQVYVPVTEPYLQEDGFRWESGARKVSNRDSSASMESILHPWQVLTPKSKPMISPNGRYIAGLSVDCEFLVMINPDHPSSNTHVPPEILWSTKRPYGKHGYVEDHCFALLKGPHLVVTIGENPQHQQFGAASGQNRILWHSDARNDEDDSRDGYYEYEDEFGFWHKRQRSYLAQLDNDGALTVYSVWSVPQDNKENYFQKGGGQQFYSPRNHLSSYKTKLMVANVANRAKDFWKGRTLAKDEYDHLYSSSKSLTYKRCVYSTHGSNLPLGLGCSIVSRKLHQLAYECAFYARRVLFTINAVTDTWLDLIYEEDDIFYTLKESFVNSKMATLSARMIRKIQETLKRLQFKK